ncbi:refilin B isoform X2 [Conger conger]|uniref:refilin B isoform X2 n=1 Tax=Conger conger TaxID=82655 RepID=UPI002A5AE489|nr:refilin B isoform X2 [Conger conger]
MLGRFNLPNVYEDDLYMNCASGRPLDSPDSGLPPSPCPSAWLQPAWTSPRAEEAGGGTPEAGAVTAFSPLFRPLSYREEIELDPLPPKVVRYTSSVRYDSDRHFIQCVSLQPRGFGLESCSQTVVALSHNTWRYYRTQLRLEPRQRAQRYQSTSILYPKHACAIYVTHLHYDCRRHTRRFLSGVELEPLHG